MSDNVSPRKDFLDWDTTWIAMAQIISMRSKDPNTRCGAVIVDADNHVVGIGYNGFPRGISSCLLPWNRDGDYEERKYPYVVHAELNSILFGDSRRIPGGRIYCSLFPCSDCVKSIIQSKISEVIYVSDKYHDTPDANAARKMLDMADIKIRQFVYNRDTIIIDMVGK